MLLEHPLSGVAGENVTGLGDAGEPGIVLLGECRIYGQWRQLRNLCRTRDLDRCSGPCAGWASDHRNHLVHVDHALHCLGGSARIGDIIGRDQLDGVGSEHLVAVNFFQCELSPGQAFRAIDGDWARQRAKKTDLQFRCQTVGTDRASHRNGGDDSKPFAARRVAQKIPCGRLHEHSPRTSLAPRHAQLAHFGVGGYINLPDSYF